MTPVTVREERNQKPMSGRIFPIFLRKLGWGWGWGEKEARSLGGGGVAFLTLMFAVAPTGAVLLPLGGVAWCGCMCVRVCMRVHLSVCRCVCACV